MKNRSTWITLSIINLCIVALLGFTMRTKFLFPMPMVDYRNLLSAHSHFAFGGWVTLILMVLLIESFLSRDQKDRKVYQWMLWGIQLSSLGMLLSFPFQGYGLFSIIFSTLFILFTYGFSWIFIQDLWKTQKGRIIRLLVISALVSLVVSSGGPFSLAYMMATKSGNATQFRDAIYYFLHFQYNGFFTLAVFSLFFHEKIGQVIKAIEERIYWFSLVLCISIPPSFFLSLLWHFFNPRIRVLAFVGCGLILLSLFLFYRVYRASPKLFVFRHSLANGLLGLSMISFVLKMLLQTGTIFPDLGNAVFGYRPIIIGFLHLVFLGLVTFYIFSHLIEKGLFVVERNSVRLSIIFFSAAIIFNEAILLVNGIGLLLKNTNPIFGWLLWIASFLLFIGAFWIMLSRVKKGWQKELART